MWEILLIYIKMMMMTNEVLIRMGSIKFVGTDSGQTTSYYYIYYILYNTHEMKISKDQYHASKDH